STSSIDIDLPPLPTRRSSDLHHDHARDFAETQRGGEKELPERSGQADAEQKQPAGRIVLGHHEWQRQGGERRAEQREIEHDRQRDRKSTRLNSSHVKISYAVF